MAAEWLMRWHCGDMSIADRFEYLEWLKTSPVHISETIRMCVLYSYLYNSKPLPATESDQPVVPIGLDRGLADALAKARRQGNGRLQSRDHSGIHARTITAVAAMISVGMGTLNLAWAVLHTMDPMVDALFRALPMLATAIPVLVSVSALIFGAVIGLRAVRWTAGR
jgi:hypothetical protein